MTELIKPQPTWVADYNRMDPKLKDLKAMVDFNKQPPQFTVVPSGKHMAELRNRWLIKNGFHLHRGKYYRGLYFSVQEFSDAYVVRLYSKQIKKIKYVQQLQLLYFALYDEWLDMKDIDTGNEWKKQGQSGFLVGVLHDLNLRRAFWENAAPLCAFFNRILFGSLPIEDTIYLASYAE